MASFDDLLAPSRRALEENPFDDPFARPGSPDPWATPFKEEVQEQAAEEQVQEEVEHVEEPRSTTPPATVTDPLESADNDEDDDDDDEPLGKRLSSPGPGFKEASFSEIATIRPTEPEETSPHDDSDDDKPIGQIVKERSHSASPQRSRRNDIQPVFVITVDDPQKVGDPIRSFTMYTVHTRVFHSLLCGVTYLTHCRQLLRSSKNPHSLSSGATLIFFGCTRPSL